MLTRCVAGASAPPPDIVFMIPLPISGNAHGETMMAIHKTVLYSLIAFSLPTSLAFAGSVTLDCGASLPPAPASSQCFAAAEGYSNPTPYTFVWQNAGAASFSQFCPPPEGIYAWCGAHCIADGNGSIKVDVYDANSAFLGSAVRNFSCSVIWQ